MTDFISWPKADDVSFREAYLQITGEIIQSDPNDADTRWQVGSGRLTEDMRLQLLAIGGVEISNSPTNYISPSEQERIRLETGL